MMTGKKMQDRKLEELSQEELQKKIEEDKKKVKSSLVLAFSAVIAIIALCIAWFVANNLVNGKSSTLAADSDVPFVLASTGVRQETEEKHFWEDMFENKKLNNGTEQTYDSYYDLSSSDAKVPVEKKQVYYTGTSDLAWHLKGQESFRPGASGKIEFYIIPKRDGLHSVTVNLDMEAYNNTGRVSSSASTEDAETGTGKEKAIQINDKDLKNLLSGHILFFQKLNDVNGYSEWINPENASFQVVAPGESFTKNVPYKITVYWVWPKYLRNYVYNSRSINGDLFSDITDANPDYVAIRRMINVLDTNGAGRVNRMYYNNDSSGAAFTTLPGSTEENKIIDKDMRDSVLNTWSSYYDQADEYIGSNVKYVYVKASVQ